MFPELEDEAWKGKYPVFPSAIDKYLAERFPGEKPRYFRKPTYHIEYKHLAQAF